MLRDPGKHLCRVCYIIAHIQSAQRSYMTQTEGLENKIYWERLKCMRLQSVHRRHEIQGYIPLEITLWFGS